MLPNTPSTISFSDLYGATPPGWAGMDTPRERDSANASGEYSENSTLNHPLVFWAVMIGLLMAVRLLWEKAG